MIKFVADEDFDNRILRALMRRSPDIDLVRIQDIHLRGADDPTVLAWAAQERRVLLTHDVSTMTNYAYERMRTGETTTGIIEVPQSMSIGKVIQDLLTIVACSSPDEFEDQILYLPL